MAALLVGSPKEEGGDKETEREREFPFPPVPTFIRSLTGEIASRPIGSSSLILIILIFRGSSSPIGSVSNNRTTTNVV